MLSFSISVIERIGKLGLEGYGLAVSFVVMLLVVLHGVIKLDIDISVIDYRW